jgi:hypothetical protein
MHVHVCACAHMCVDKMEGVGWGRHGPVSKAHGGDRTAAMAGRCSTCALKRASQQATQQKPMWPAELLQCPTQEVRLGRGQPKPV